MMETEKPTAAFLFSLLGGIFILIGGSIAVAFGTFAMMGGFQGMMGRFGGMMGGPSFGAMAGFGIVFGSFGVVSGVIVLIAAAMMYAKPAQREMWSILIIVFSVASLIGAGGGFIVGFILGIIGGILGLATKPGQREAGTVPR